MKSQSSLDCCSETEIRRACGSQSLARLQAAIIQSGWTVSQLDALPGKSALQLAAWKGCLSNVQYLVQLGCDINQYSTATFSYGKTPIFFALTQSRQDVVQYLLELPKIQVAIVNNKGQSVLSLAASHDMPNSVLQKIQQLEQQQTWWNFRKTHSDGLIYGDLDPRFLERDIQESDVVNQWAVNPTSNSTRKGNFARKNPQVAKESKKNTSMKKIKSSTRNIEVSEKLELQDWQQALQRLKSATVDEASTILLNIILVGEKLRSAWIPQVVEQLAFRKTDAIDTILQHAKILTKRQDQNSNRIDSLLDKISQRLATTQSTKANICVLNHITGIPKETTPSNPHRKWTQSVLHVHSLLQSNCGQQAQERVKRLTIHQELEHDDSSILRLSTPPIWIDTVEPLVALRMDLQNAMVLGIDTEWYNDEVSSTLHIATFQLAYVTSEGTIAAYIVDTKLPLADDYFNEVRRLIAWILDDSHILALGFSVGHDIPLLEILVGRKLQPTSLLDVQLLFAESHSSNLPSLKTCTSKFSRTPLCKEQQCSNWGQRPLSRAQTEYAGLDAAILLYLLAEYTSDTSKVMS